MTLNSACKWSSILDNNIKTIIFITIVVICIKDQICRCCVANSSTSPCIYIYFKCRVSCFASACIGKSTVSSWIIVTRNSACKWRSAIKFKSIITSFTLTYVCSCIQICRCWVANRCTFPFIIKYCKYRVNWNASARIGSWIIISCSCITLNSACKWITT
jgi:hypothetical protein